MYEGRGVGGFMVLGYIYGVGDRLKDEDYPERKLDLQQPHLLSRGSPISCH